jgi:hypothetical protein
MVRADVVDYLRENLKKFPVEDLRSQLVAEGVSPQDFETALKEAQKAPAGAPTKVKAKASGVMARLLLFAGMAAILAAAGLAVFQKPAAAPETAAAVAAAGGVTSTEAGFVGHSGYVIKLPTGYTAVQSFKDPDRKTTEVVHFCRSETDPTAFLDEGLFGQLGIVRLVVSPSPIRDDLNGLENLTTMLQNRALSRGEKFAVKTLQVSNLRGVQIVYEQPFPRVEAYLLGRSMMYSFTGGQDDETYRGLLQSLRDSRSEI